MLRKKSLQPQKKSLTFSISEERYIQKNLRCSNLRTESLENRSVNQKNEDSKKLSQSKKKLKSNQFRSFYKQKNVKAAQQSTKKLYISNKFMINNNIIENNSTIQFVPRQISNLIQTCENLIKNQQFQEAIQQLDDIDHNKSFQECQNQIAFLKGLIYIQIHQYEKAISNLQECIQYQDLNGQALVLLSIAYGKIGNYEEGISILEEYLQKSKAKLSPANYDARLQKGKLLMKQKKFQLAIHEFTLASVLEKGFELFQGRQGKGDCLSLSGNFHEALMIYDSLPKNNKVQIRKAYCLLELKQFEKANEIINNILKTDPKSSSALLQKGLILLRTGFVDEAILRFEESIIENNSRKAVTQCLLEITKIKIEQKDFYSAFYTIQREDHLKLNKQSITDLKMFTEGVMFIMKRDYDEAIINFTKLINSNQLEEFIKKQIFYYRAYGFMYKQEYKKALQDLLYHKDQYKLDPASQYNMLICQGILMSQQNLFKKAISTFSKASQLNPQKMEPYYYKGLTLIQFVFKHKPDERDYFFQSVLKYLNKAFTLKFREDLYYHRGIMLFYFGQFQKALSDLNEAIYNMSTYERHFKVFYARGLVKAFLNDYYSALKDITQAINLEPNNPEIYLNRAKVLMQINQQNQALNDLQTCILLRPQDPQLHLQAGNILFLYGYYKNAIQYYSQFYNIQNNIDLLSQKAKCQIIQKELYQAFADLNRVHEITIDPKYYIDKECLNALQRATNKNSIESQENLNLTQKYENYRLASQILKEIINLNNDGYLFMRSDLFFYRGVIKFYQGNYIKAIQNWKTSYGLKQQRENDEDSSMNSQSQNLFDSIISELGDLEFQDRVYNMYEYYYNVTLANLLNSGNLEDQKIFEDLADKLPQTYFASINQFRNAIHAQQSQNAYIFPFDNRLCYLFPIVKIGNAMTRLSFCLPKIPTPSMKFEFDYQLLQHIQATDVEINPEAPWIKRKHSGLIITEKIQADDIDSPRQVLSQQQNQFAIQIEQEVQQNVIINDDSTICLSD